MNAEVKRIELSINGQDWRPAFMRVLSDEQPARPDDALLQEGFEWGMVAGRWVPVAVFAS